MRGKFSWMMAKWRGLEERRGRGHILNNIATIEVRLSGDAHNSVEVNSLLKRYLLTL